jgi:hypothetical protein
MKEHNPDLDSRDQGLPQEAPGVWTNQMQVESGLCRHDEASFSAAFGVIVLSKKELHIV